VAKAVLEQFNPKMSVEARNDKLSQSLEDTYDDAFFCQFDVVVCAIDNVEGRKYIDQRCVENRVIMVESGTLGTKGHVQVVVPFLTESYSSQSDPLANEEIPFCTLRLFPYEAFHCIE